MSINKTMRKNKNKQNNYQSGFTLIETFVAITILMIVVLGPMSLLSNALKDARYIGEEITATYLAQEGVELMIDKRNQGETLGDYSCDLYYSDTNNQMTDGYNCEGLGSKTIFNRAIEVVEVVTGQWGITSTVTRIGGKPVVSRSIIFVN